MKKIGFVGMGNMAQALVKGFLQGDQTLQVSAYAPTQDKLRKNAEQFGFEPVRSLRELADSSEVVIMACKPQQIEEVLQQIGTRLVGKALLSVAAGWDYARYQGYLQEAVRVQYIMPNTPAMVGQGVFLFEKKNSLTEEEHRFFTDLFRTMGMVEELPTEQMKLGMTLTGCGPAFVDMMLEAYADAAVKYGMPREKAFRLISQMIAGTALLQQKTGEHPEVLKDKVCSPGGTTIVGCNALEESGFRNACIKSVDAIMKMN